MKRRHDETDEVHETSRPIKRLRHVSLDLSSAQAPSVLPAHPTSPQIHHYQRNDVPPSGSIPHPPGVLLNTTCRKVHIFDLSDELLLRILSYLHIDSLTSCELVCRKVSGLAKDNELWREKYFHHFVRHRARRLPSLKPMKPEEQENSALRYSSRRAKWLEHRYLVEAKEETRWKQTFKVKHNWTRGRAKTTEVQVGPRSVPAVLAKVHRGYLITVDKENGLRLWKHGTVRHALQTCQSSAPSALDVESAEDITRIVIGHMDGTIVTYAFEQTIIRLVSTALGSSNSQVVSVAVAWPYLMTMSRSSTITLYQYIQSTDREIQLKRLTNLHCDADLSPASLSLRKTKTTLVAGIAYAFNRFNTGWCLGLQEIRMNFEGTITRNRTTSNIDTALPESFPASKPDFISRSAHTSPFGLHPHLMRAPNSLSYCGCYILAGLPDNTLMVYVVSSTDDKLEINVGRRLWGHTSAVSAAEVTSTGKAVSISAKSDEMRYWELEEVLSSYSQKKTSTTIEPLKMLTEAISRRGDGIGLALKEVKQQADLFVRKCVSFDDEQAIVVGERDQRQVISCFDFA